MMCPYKPCAHDVTDHYGDGCRKCACLNTPELIEIHCRVKLGVNTDPQAQSIAEDVAQALCVSNTDTTVYLFDDPVRGEVKDARFRIATTVGNFIVSVRRTT